MFFRSSPTSAVDVPTKARTQSIPPNVDDTTPEYPCGSCRKPCIGSDDMGCESCNSWYHSTCESISQSDLTFLSKTSLPYVCKRCNLNEHGVFDYEASLRRISAAIDTKPNDAATIERIFLRDESSCVTHDRMKYDNWSMDIDSTARHLLGSNWQSSIPVSVSGDGNCLFNSLSVAMYGHELYAMELRLRCVLELIEHKDHYMNCNEHTSIQLVSPSIDEATSNCATLGSFSSSWVLHAAASVLSANIKSVYPLVNGITDQCISILNRTFIPRNNGKNKQIQIMWSGPKCGQTWTPNHFVPLLDCETSSLPKDNLIRIDDDDEFPPLTLSRSSAPKTSPPLKTTKNKDKTMTVDTAEISSLNDSYVSKSGLFDNTEQLNEYVDELNKENSLLDVSSSSDKVEHPFSNPVANSLPGKFMSAESQFLLIGENCDLVDEIPKGVKENVYFLLNDNSNKNRRAQGKSSQYIDDCGAWKSSSNVTKTEYFLKTQNGYQSIRRDKNGTYFRIVRRQNIPMSPQPNENQVAILKRKYSVLARRLENINSSLHVH
ncbi:hypothetical protein FSP39_022462 [Pinctada imbricata]|uniref:Vertnin n=1 Tax=Pinctada imbricata TaxID=66713 RepID=A0AA88YFK5_PINIB|nr:hypothetical protein FSP39_022462 [Pinctada imbricata]